MSNRWKGYILGIFHALPFAAAQLRSIWGETGGAKLSSWRCSEVRTPLHPAIRASNRRPKSPNALGSNLHTERCKPAFTLSSQNKNLKKSSKIRSFELQFANWWAKNRQKLKSEETNQRFRSKSGRIQDVWPFCRSSFASQRNDKKHILSHFEAISK